MESSLKIVKNFFNENPDFLYADTSDRKEIVVNDETDLLN